MNQDIFLEFEIRNTFLKYGTIMTGIETLFI